MTAFITMSDVKDEIDYEFVGTELTIAQTNYYAQGRPVCESSMHTISCFTCFIPTLPTLLNMQLTIDV